MWERRTQPLISRPHFARRMIASLLLAGLVVAVGLGIGVAGYHYVAGLSWIDAVLNAAMILTGMGPVNPLSTDAAKLFASAYALFSGVVFLSAIALTLTPVFHRVLHRFHLSDEDIDDDRS